MASAITSAMNTAEPLHAIFLNELKTVLQDYSYIYGCDRSALPVGLPSLEAGRGATWRFLVPPLERDATNTPYSGRRPRK